MSFLDTVETARAFLERNGRVSLRALRREFALGDEALEDLVEELVDVQRIAGREGNVLSWIGAAAAEASAEAAAERQPAAAERRQLTVLFCDLVNSTRLATVLDPEDWREVVRGYQQRAAEVVERFDGHVAQYLGDGLLVYFGYPKAHEDDAERAVRAGLGIVDAVADGNESLDANRGLELAVRIGIHTGPVVVGEMGGGERRETLALGDTTNVAARIQDEAEPDTVVMSAATARLVSGIFVTEDLGGRELKGLGEVHVHRAIRISGMRSRVDVAAAMELTPLVGREQELGLLEDRFTQVCDGSGQAVLISGEAGIGKSRLMQALRERIAERAHTWLDSRCSPYSVDSALFPVLELQRRGLGFQAEDSLDMKLESLEAGLRASDFELDQTLPLMASLHGLPLPESYEDPVQSPETRRKKTLELLVEWLLRLGRLQPLVLLIEDLHWVDPSTQELLGQILERIPREQVLLLATYRPDFEPPWGARSHLTPMLLARLARPQLGDLIRKAAARDRDLPEAWVEEIIRRSDGVPLFAEELTKTVLESNPSPPKGGEEPTLRIPETLQDSLTARIDQLGPVKEIAQLASVLGREFTYDLLLEISPMGEEPLRRALADAVTEELFYQRGTPPDASYLFKHALIRDAVYQSMLRRTRQGHHRRVAQTLTERVPDAAEAQPEVVAYHLAEAGEVERAVVWWSRAGDKALATGAASEAERCYERGVRAIRELSESQGNAARELDLQIGLGAAMHASRGWGSPDVRPVWERVRELASAIGSPPHLARASAGLSAHLTGQGQIMEGIASSDRTIEIADEIGDEDLVLNGLQVGMAGRAFAGRPLEVLDLGERALPLLQLEVPGRGIQPMGNDQESAVLSFVAMANAQLGHLDEALRFADKAIEWARRTGHPNSLCFALVLGGTMSRIYRGELGELPRLTEELLELTASFDLPLWDGVARVYRGAALAILTGDPREGDAAREGLGMAEATGLRAAAPLMLRVVAEAELRFGRVDAVLEIITAALAVAEATGQHFDDSQLHGVRGQALRQRDPEAAASAFRHGLEIARQQSAKSSELHVATEFALLRRDQGHGAEARSLLAPVHDWFTEGLDTPLLQNAKALLDELASPSIRNV